MPTTAVHRHVLPGPLVAIVLALGLGAAHAETPYERDQREQMEKYQREHGLSPQVQQRLRWESEWRAQHPGQPLPNAGQLQKMHTAEIQANINAGFARMRAQRQAQLQREYQMSRDRQVQINAANHVNWTPAQWAAWNQRYDDGKRAEAQAYLNAVKLSGEMNHENMAREERERLWRQP